MTENTMGETRGTMKRIALTGGIASGKSTVSALIRRAGVPVADADILCRHVMAPETEATQKILRLWPQVGAPAGGIDRPALGRLLFADAEARRAEEAIVLPAIQQAFETWAADQAREGAALCVYDAALIFEHGLEGAFDGVLLVAADARIQADRLRARNGLSESEAQRRIAAQWPLSEKLKKATWVIFNNGPREALESSFAQVWREVLASLGMEPPRA